MKGNIKYKGMVINKIEWHAVNGIDEVVLKYIQDQLQVKGIAIDKLKVILY